MTLKCSVPDTRRTYILYPYEMVADHMTGEEYGNPEEILDGNIDELLLSRIRHRNELEHPRWWRGNADMGPCSYCGSTYKSSQAYIHFIPCHTCGDLEHAGCRH